MKGKFSNLFVYSAARFKRWVIRRQVAPLVEWDETSRIEQDGYTLLIGCKHELIDVLTANMRLLARCDVTGLFETIIGCDTIETPQWRQWAARLTEEFPSLRPRVLFYNEQQNNVARRLQLPWVYCWLNWMQGLRATRTQVAVLHDLDAMFLDPSILANRYRRFIDLGVDFYGDSYYQANGLQASDTLVTTWEMFLKVSCVREFAPVDLFNKIGSLGDRKVDFDITLWIQTQGLRRLAESIDRESFVHPSQVIHQVTELQRRKRYRIEMMPTIFFTHYFSDLGGNPSSLQELISALERNRFDEVPVYGGVVDLSAMSQSSAVWFDIQIGRLEKHLFGEVRRHVAQFLNHMHRVADWAESINSAAVADTISR